MSDYYQGKTAVITGGASGVGRSIAFGIGRAGPYPPFEAQEKK